ncbi:MAG: hypothetical protein M3541_13465 [Acidobacteriota bacterium]|nr:hypothetical protein [Acidobacteriota bacterium]
MTVRVGPDSKPDVLLGPHAWIRVSVAGGRVPDGSTRIGVVSVHGTQEVGIDSNSVDLLVAPGTSHIYLGEIPTSSVDVTTTPDEEDAGTVTLRRGTEA